MIIMMIMIILVPPVPFEIPISSHRLLPFQIHRDLVVCVHQSGEGVDNDEADLFNISSQKCVIPYRLQTACKMKFLIPNKPTGRMCLFKSAPSDVEEIFSGYLETNISDRYSQMIALCLKIVDYRSWTGYPRSLKRVVCGSLPTIRCQELWQHKAPICSAGRFFLII